MSKEKKPTLGKQAITNLLVLLFCVVFITLHTLVFGENNNIIGVILLIGILMMMKGDLGFHAKQAALSIVFIFILLAVAPTLSLINPFLGILVNGFSILLIMILSSHDVSMSNHVPFMMGYLFCHGYPVAGKDYLLRVISLVIGGLLIAFLYYSSNKEKEYKRTIADLFKELKIHSLRTRWYIKLTVLLTATIFVCELLHYPRTMWVALTVLSLTLPFEEDASKRGKVRIPAAILGTALFYLLFVVIVPISYQSMVVLLASYIAMFTKNYFLKSIYNSFSALGTAVLLFPANVAMALRIYSNILGTVIAFVGYFLFKWIFHCIDQKQTA